MTAEELEDELAEVVRRAAAAGLGWDAIMDAIQITQTIVTEEAAEDLR